MEAMPKLYVVEALYRGYILAESQEEAVAMYHKILEEVPDLDWYEAEGNELKWDPGCLVYNRLSKDITVEEALKYNG